MTDLNSPAIADPVVTPRPPIPVFKFLGLPIHRRMRTGEPHVGWDSVFMLSLLWFPVYFNIFVGGGATTGQALTFTIQRYNHDPRAIAFVGTFSLILMIGPFINYFSDSVWTRLGRRRPFIMVTLLGGVISMLSLAFFSQVSGAINHTLGMMGIPQIGDIFILAGIIFCFKKMLEFGGPLEAFCLECVPSHQRGRFFAIRGIVFTLAMMLFFQVLWPFYDDQVDILAPLGHPNFLILKGEQVIYLVAGAFFAIAGLYLVFCTEEVKVPNAANKTCREILLGPEVSPGAAPLPPLPKGWRGFRERLNRIPIVTFVVGFCKSSLFTPTYFPFYIIGIIPLMEQTVWGSFGALMQNDQFGYSKANQSLYALPMGLLTMCALTPFAGWYADVRIDLKWRYRILLLAFSVACVAGTVWLCSVHAPSDIRKLPALWVLFAISILLGLGLITLFVPMVETLLDVVGREHARAWVSVLAVAKKLIIVAALYLVILLSPHHVPTILTWTVFFILSSATDALLNTFVQPMMFDYVSRNVLGTIFAGMSVYNNFITLFIANVGGWWVFSVANSVSHAHASSKNVAYDYTSLYQLQLFFLVLAILVKCWFLWLVVKGRIKKVGELEVRGTP